MPKVVSTSWSNWLVKLPPLSCWISTGTPKVEKISTKALAVVVASTLLNGVATGYLVAKSIAVSKYL